MSQTDAKKIIRIISVIAALIGGGVGYDVLTDDVPAEPTREEAPARPAERKRCIFASYRDGEWVTGWGTVKKILPDTSGRRPGGYVRKAKQE